MSSTSEFFPEGDLKDFILMHVVRPEVEAFCEKGIPIEAQTSFLAGNERRAGRKLGAVKRSLPVEIELRCRSWWPNVIEVAATCRAKEIPVDCSIEWDLKVTVRKDEKGWYAQGLHISALKDR